MSRRWRSGVCAMIGDLTGVVPAAVPQFLANFVDAMIPPLDDPGLGSGVAWADPDGDGAFDLQVDEAYRISRVTEEGQSDIAAMRFSALLLAG